MTASNTPGKRGRGRLGSTPLPSMTFNLTTAQFAHEAIECLIDNGGFVDDNKKQFALRLGWVLPGSPGGIDVPNVRLVQDVCNLTRDQDEWEPIKLSLGGFVITYSPSRGGMLLIDPSGEMPLLHIVHMLIGDLQRQNGIKTQHRRRVPYWKAAGDGAVQTGDHDMARVFFQGEGEIKSTGFVSDSTIGALFELARSRGLLGNVA